jgi:hypothetical protein
MPSSRLDEVRPAFEAFEADGRYREKHARDEGLSSALASLRESAVHPLLFGSGDGSVSVPF